MAPAVHPRERGEHQWLDAASAWLDGSSPRARGTLSSSRQPRGVTRFIPASAGNTAVPAASNAPTSVHPRERGEHRPWRCRRSPWCGSSPRARGTRKNRVVARRGPRFIPASAGNTTRPRPAFCARSVHPRERGEHDVVRKMAPRDDGSSPRARGTQSISAHLVIAMRFIPASAGNTICASERGPDRAVHPRERGEHRRGPKGWRRVERFIPASAGNTKTSCATVPKNRGSSPRARGTRVMACSTRCRSAVHPRERGEHHVQRATKKGSHGSSPRARGTRDSHWPALSKRRFIPASAGNTACRSGSPHTATVHPRERGEHAHRAAAVGF